MFSKMFTLSAINSSPNNVILDWSKFKAFADDEINVTQKLKFVKEMVEKIMGKGENAGHQHFLPSIFSSSQNVFKMLLSQSC